MQISNLISIIMEAHNNQQVFLSNKNKIQFISLLGHHLKANAQVVHNSSGDTDTMIVSCALQFATQGNYVIVVVDDDIDILVLLIHHWNPSMADVYFQSDAQKKMWKIRDVVAEVGDVV